MLDLGKAWAAHLHDEMALAVWRRNKNTYFPGIRLDEYMRRMQRFVFHKEDGWDWAQNEMELHFLNRGNLFATISAARKIAQQVADKYGYAYSRAFAGSRKAAILGRRLGFLPVGRSDMMELYAIEGRS